MDDLRKVLFVDDEEDLCAMVKMNLEDTGEFRVLTTTDAAKVPALCKIEKPDVVVIDLVMPKLNGLEVVKQLKRHRATYEIPIVIVSGLGEMVYFKRKSTWQWAPNSDAVLERDEVLDSKNVRSISRELGADSCLKKPFTTEDLIEIIHETLSSRLYGTRMIKLQYTPIVEPRPKKNVDIYVSPFLDYRPEKKVIGHVRDGHGIKTAKVTTADDVSQWVEEAIKIELANMGYTVVYDDTARIKVSGLVNNIYVTSALLCDSKVVITGNLNIQLKEFYSRLYEGSDEKLKMIATGRLYAQSLDISLQKAVYRAITDIDHTISEYKFLLK